MKLPQWLVPKWARKEQERQEKVEAPVIAAVSEPDEKRPQTQCRRPEARAKRRLARRQRAINRVRDPRFAR